MEKLVFHLLEGFWVHYLYYCMNTWHNRSKQLLPHQTLDHMSSTHRSWSHKNTIIYEILWVNKSVLKSCKAQVQIALHYRNKLRFKKNNNIAIVVYLCTCFGFVSCSCFMSVMWSPLLVMWSCHVFPCLMCLCSYWLIVSLCTGVPCLVISPCKFKPTCLPFYFVMVCFPVTPCPKTYCFWI